MKTKTMILAGATALSMLAGCEARAEGKRAEVFHWWTSGGEAAAVKELAKVFESQGGTWVDTAIAGSGSTARPIGINRILGGDPPSAMQLNAGTQMNDLADGGYLRPLDDLAEAEGWQALMPPTFWTAVQRNGHVWAEPIDDHGLNWMWYSKAVFQKAGVTDEPKSWDDLFADLAKIKAAGLIPVAVGGQPWQLTLTFNDVLLGVGGRDLYAKVWRDQDQGAVKSEAFKKVAETFARLRDYQDAGSPNRDWNLATALVLQDKAGVQFMGDWAKGEYVSAGKVAGTDYGCILGPGQENFVLSGDVLVFPKLKDQGAIDAQALLAAAVISKEGQLAFNAKKGSLPVRLDVNTDQLDACARKGIAVLKGSANQVSASDILAPQDLVQSVFDIVAQYWTTPSMTADQFADKWVELIRQTK